MHKFNHRGSVIASMLFGIIVLLIAAGAVVMFHSNLADFYYEVKKDLLPATAVVQKYITVTSTKKVEKSSAVTKVERKKSKSEAPSASNPPMESQVVQTPTIPPPLPTIKIDVAEPVAPPPLRLPVKESFVLSGRITAEGVVAATNRQRTEQGLPPFQVNTLLASAATLKVDDMFEFQYFAHESTRTGEGAADLAARVGYKFILIGENLALGNTFETAEDIVTGWMNSPGHRANILKAGYQEIGIAVKKGVYEGTEVWMAVQEFGAPQSACAEPDANLKAALDALDARMDSISEELGAKKVELETSSPESDSSYNDKVDAYNSLVGAFNQSVEEQKKDSATYNEQVRAYNGCLAGIAGGKT